MVLVCSLDLILSNSNFRNSVGVRYWFALSPSPSPKLGSGNFILDFYCAAHKLVVEVDGGIHETQIEYDAARTTELESYGYKIVRFTNEVVLHQLETVLAEILQAIELHSVRDTDPKSGW
jgi:Protein of unknown function (DUF559)